MRSTQEVPADLKVVDADLADLYDQVKNARVERRMLLHELQQAKDAEADRRGIYVPLDRVVAQG